MAKAFLYEKYIFIKNRIKYKKKLFEIKKF